MPLKVRCPEGHEITGTFERVYGEALIVAGSWRRAETAVFFDQAGETKIDWDSQEAVTVNGEPIFLCTGGCETKQSDLVIEEEPES